LENETGCCPAGLFFHCFVEMPRLLAQLLGTHSIVSLCMLFRRRCYKQPLQQLLLLYTCRRNRFNSVCLLHYGELCGQHQSPFCSM